MRLAAFLTALLLAAPAHPTEIALAGPDYWHPPVTSLEVVAGDGLPTRRLSGATRERFVAEVVRQALAGHYGPRLASFARGPASDELVVVALDDQVFASVQRARAALAQLSVPGRSATRLVASRTGEPVGFYAALEAAGFSAVTISDGVSWTHRIELR